MASSYRAKNITTQTTTAVANGPTTLGVVNVNTGAAGAILKLYDAANAATTIIATIDASAACTRVYACYLKNGLTAVTSVGNADITLTYE